MSEKLILFPFGGNAREAVSFLMNDINDKRWNILGFVDDNSSEWGRDCCGVKVLGGKDILGKYPDAYVLAVPGNPDNYLKRREIINGCELDDSRFCTVSHSSVIAARDAKIGYNTLLMPNVVIGCGVTVGNHCVVLPNTVIAHDSVIEDYCCIGANVTISGNNVIGEGCYIGSGSCVRDNILIGKMSLVGLGSNVVSNIEKGIVVAGNPAREIRKVS